MTLSFLVGPLIPCISFFKRAKGVVKPIDKKSNYVKRNVGSPGDSLAVINGDVFINGEKLVFERQGKTRISSCDHDKK